MTTNTILKFMTGMSKLIRALRRIFYERKLLMFWYQSESHQSTDFILDTRDFEQFITRFYKINWCTSA